MEWFLLIILRFDVGTHREPVTITGGVPYVTEEECTQHGVNLTSWLKQDFVNPEYHCIPHLKRAEGEHHDDYVTTSR